MRSRIRKALIVLVPVLACVFGIGGMPTAQADDASSVESVRSQLADLELQQGKLAQQDSELQAKMAAAQGQLDATRAQIAQKKADVEALRPQIAQIALQQYQDAGVNTAAVVFSSTNSTDLLNQITITQQVASTADALIQTLQLEQAALADLQRSEDATVAEIQADQQALDDLKTANDAKVKETQKLLNKMLALRAAQAAAAAKPTNPGPIDTTVAAPSGALLPPVTGYLVTRTFGSYGHTGIDLAKPCGTQVVAPANGVVVDYAYDGSLGNKLTIDNGTINGHHIITAYAHLSGSLVSPGEPVVQGQGIALVGMTGAATGCHLHFMLWTDGQLVNPGPYIGA